MEGKLLGKILVLKDRSNGRCNGLTVVPFEIKPDEDGDYYNCIVVNGNLLGSIEFHPNGRGIGTIISMSLDLGSPIEEQGIKIFDIEKYIVG